MALAAAGRAVSLEELRTWRKDGLLPPLASYGLGTGKGKSYYWREGNILEQAQAACDAMRRHGRTDHTLVTLFLSGFPVPLAQLRRAWLNRVRLRKPPSVHVTRERPDAIALMDPGTDSLLLQAALCAGAAIHLDGTPEQGAMELLLSRAAAKLGLIQHGANDPGLTGQLSHLLLVVGSVLDQGNLVREAADQDLLDAQRYLGTAITFLSDCGDVAGLMTTTAGSLLFVLFLTLLRSGQTNLLHQMMEFLGRTGRPVRPARNLALPA